ncbi:MAG: hypothetical protein QOJ03_2911 [Frankiaceae bacterium]|nr:hypothetical protein [Frankiaceae bacterium]
MRGVGWVIALLAVAGCGSTVQPGAVGSDSSSMLAPTQQSTSMPAGGSTGLAGPTSSGGAAIGGSAAAPDDGGAVTGGGITGGGAADGTTGAAGGASTPSAARSGPGFTATEVKVGVAISSSSNAAFGAYGAKGLSFPDGKQLVNAYVAHLNRTGGIGGRHVVPVFYDYNATGNVSTSDAAACAAWTQDDRVVAALGVRAGATGTDDGLTPCLSKAGVPWMSGQGDAAKFAAYPKTLYAPALINSTRLAKAVVDALYARGFFGAGARVGVVYQDNPEMARAVSNGLRPALAAHGLPLVKQAAESNAFTESANIELRFATAGITHVLFAAPGGASPWQFMQSAQQNRHHYHYGISSDDQPAIILERFAPQGQLATTEGFGYAPTQDVDPSQAPKPTAALAACLKVFREAGFDTSSGTAQLAMSFVCDPFELMRSGWRAAPTLSAVSLADGVDRLGTSFGVAGTFAARFAPGRHDGADAYRPLRYATGCSCFTYSGAVRRTG